MTVLLTPSHADVAGVCGPFEISASAGPGGSISASGAVSAPAISEEFSGVALPAGWAEFVWPAGSGPGSATVAGGKLTVTGARANPEPYATGPGHSMVFDATFAPEPFQAGGFGGGSQLPPGEVFDAPPFAVFHTGSSGSALITRVWNGGGFLDFTIPGSWLGTPHRFRVDWTPSTIDFYIDGSLVHSEAAAIAGPMRPAFSDFIVDGPGLTVDDLQVGPYPIACGASQAFTITADPCFSIADVLVDGGSVGAVTTYTFTNVTANHTIAASFSANGPYTILASAGTGGSIDPGGAVSVSCGANPGFTVTPGGGFNIQDVLVDGVSAGAVGSYTFTDVQADHTIAASFLATGPNRSPECGVARAVPDRLWSADHQLVPVTIAGVTDPDGDPVTITVTGVTQDESPNESGDGNTCPDAVLSDGAVQLRAERSGAGNGRVYAVSFSASDGRGGSCAGSVLVCVPHDLGQDPGPAADFGMAGLLSSAPRGGTCVDDGQAFNALGPCPPRKHGNALANVTLTVGPRIGSTVSLEYSLPAASAAKISLYDIAGRRLSTLLDVRQDAGTHQLSWNSANLERGMYFARLQAGAVAVTKPVLILK